MAIYKKPSLTMISRSRSSSPPTTTTSASGRKGETPLGGFLHQLISEALTISSGCESSSSSTSSSSLKEGSKNQNDHHCELLVVVSDNAKLPMNAHQCLMLDHPHHHHHAAAAAHHHHHGGHPSRMTPERRFSADDRCGSTTAAAITKGDAVALKRETRWSSFNERNPQAAGLIRPRRRRSEEFTAESFSSLSLPPMPMRRQARNDDDYDDDDGCNDYGDFDEDEDSENFELVLEGGGLMANNKDNSSNHSTTIGKTSTTTAIKKKLASTSRGVPTRGLNGWNPSI